MYIIYTNTIIGNQNTDEYMSEISAIYENILAAAADQLTTACRASFCIAAPMVQMSEERIAIVAPGCFRLSFVKVPGNTNLDAFEYAAVRMELLDGTSLCLHHVLTANLAYSAHQRTSSLLEKFFSAAIFIDVVVSEPAVVLYGGKVEARITLVLLMLDDYRLAFVVRTAAGQVFSFDQFLEFFIGHVLHLFLDCRWCPAHDHTKRFDQQTEEYLTQLLTPTKGGTRYKRTVGDNAYGVFIGYSLGLATEDRSSDQFLSAIDIKMEQDIRHFVPMIRKKIEDAGLNQTPFYFFFIPLNDAEIEKNSIVEAILR